jgi:hypothetical protein
MRFFGLLGKENRSSLYPPSSKRSAQFSRLAEFKDHPIHIPSRRFSRVPHFSRRSSGVEKRSPPHSDRHLAFQDATNHGYVKEAAKPC